MIFDPPCRSFEFERDHWRRASRASATCAIRSTCSYSILQCSKTAEQVLKRLLLFVFPCRHGASRLGCSLTMQVDPGAPAQRVAARPSMPSAHGCPMPPICSTFGSAAACAGGELVTRYFRRRRPHFECFRAFAHWSTALCEFAISRFPSYRRSFTVTLQLRCAISRRSVRCFGREVACNASFFTAVEIENEVKIHVLYLISMREPIQLWLLRLRLQDSVALVQKTSKDRRQT